MEAIIWVLKEKNIGHKADGWHELLGEYYEVEAFDLLRLSECNEAQMKK